MKASLRLKAKMAEAGNNNITASKIGRFPKWRFRLRRANQGFRRHPRRRRLGQRRFRRHLEKALLRQARSRQSALPDLRSARCKTLYAGTEPIDVFVTHDEAKSWERLDTVWNIPWVSTITYPVATVEPHVRDITIDPKDPKTMYVALQVGYMLKTTDGGKNWELLNKNLDCDVHTIVLHPDDGNKIFIATGGHDCRAGKAPGRALYSSVDGGKNWAPMAMEFKEEYSVPLAVHPTKHNVLYSAVANGQPGQWRKRDGDAQAFLIQSTDAGKSWKKLEGAVSQANHSFVESFAFDPANADNMYAAQQNGDLFGSDDSGASWFKLNVNVPELSDMKAAVA